MVTITLASLIAFVAAGLPAVTTAHLAMKLEPAPLFHAAALMFVAYAGYARIATLGEEVVEPRRTIPAAIVTTLILSMLVYMAVAVVAVGAAGADKLQQLTTERAAPLEIVAREFPLRVHWLISLGAMTAMLGVLLNLLLGLSRIALAMGRRGDLPSLSSNVTFSVLFIGFLTAALAGIGSVKTTWTFSAFSVLIYYAVTNLAALQLSDSDRLYGKAWAWIGLLACLGLAFAIPWQIWSVGLSLLGVGLLWHWFRTAGGFRQPA
jgi:APA family basic amino acid/polyamine antiporter